MRLRITTLFMVILSVILIGHPIEASTTVYFGGNDHIGTIDTNTGNVTQYSNLGLSGYVNALAYDNSGTLYGNVVGTGVGIFTSTGSFSLIATPGSIESLVYGNGSLYFGGADHIGTIDTSTGNVTQYSNLGLSGYVNALAYDSSGTLFGNVVGTGVGSLDTSGGAFSLVASPGSIESLAIVPEPISSILFITGGTFLLGRRYLRKA